MDRYLYKAKRIDTGEWVEGYYALRPDNEAVIMRKCDEAPDADPMWKKVLVTYQIDPSTLCQCTGLKDKNGALIWESDIVKLNQIGYAKRNIYAKVEFYDGCFDLKGIRWRDYLKCYVVNYAAEVIGNIYDNPELLEV